MRQKAEENKGKRTAGTNQANKASREVAEGLDAEYDNHTEVKRDFQMRLSTDVGAERGEKIADKEKWAIISAIKSGQFIMNAGGKIGQVSMRYGIYDFNIFDDGVVPTWIMVFGLSSFGPSEVTRTPNLDNPNNSEKLFPLGKDTF